LRRCAPPIYPQTGGRVRKFVVATGAIGAVAGATQPTFNGDGPVATTDMVTTKNGDNGNVCIYTSATTHIVADVNEWI